MHKGLVFQRGSEVCVCEIVQPAKMRASRCVDNIGLQAVCLCINSVQSEFDLG